MISWPKVATASLILGCGVCVTSAITAVSAAQKVTRNRVTPITALGTHRILDCLERSPCVAPGGNVYAFRVVHGDYSRDGIVMDLFSGQIGAQGASVPKLIAQLFSAALGANSSLSGPNTDSYTDVNPLRWLDDRRVSFMWADGSSSEHQVVVVDLETGRVKYLTHSETTIQSFDVGADETVIYNALVRWDNSSSADLIRSGFAVRHDSDAFALSQVNVSGASILDLTWNTEWFIEKQGQSRRKLQIGGEGSGIDHGNPSARFVKLSPDGKYAVLSAPPLAVPDTWSTYSDFNLEKRFVEEFHRDPRSWYGRDVLQLQLVDVQSGHIRPLMDAPCNFHTRAVFAPDSQSLLVGPTFTPPNDTVVMGHDGTAAIVVYPERRQYDVLPLKFPVRLNGNEWHGIGMLRLRLGNGVSVTGNAVVSRGIGGWHLSNTRADFALERGQLEIKQDIHSPPKVYFRKNRHDGGVLLFDPNPSLVDRTVLGQVERLGGLLPTGEPWEGLLFKPADFVQGRRYPLVIQLQRGAPIGSEFTLYGWSSGNGLGPAQIASYCAQCLANRGIATIELQVTKTKTDTPDEPEAIRVAVESVIDELTTRGTVDPTCVGLSGFSRNGFYVEHILTHSDRNYAAAVVADNFDGGYIQAALAGWDASVTGVIGAAPFGDGLKVWLDKSPAFNIEKIHTPLSIIEQSGGMPSMLLAAWETYSRLNYLNYPVELYVMPDAAAHGAHDPQNPRQVVAIQERVVNWFAYWLINGQERDAQPEWRELRLRRDLHVGKKDVSGDPGRELRCGDRGRPPTLQPQS